MRTKWYTKIWPWMKKYWVLVINPIVMAFAYSAVYENGFTGVEVLLGLTLFANAAYWLFVWFIGGWNKLNPQPEPPRIQYVEKIVEKIVEKPVEVIKYVEKPATKTAKKK